MPVTLVRGIAGGGQIPSPVYLDANVVVSYFVPRSNSAAAFVAIAEVPAQGLDTILSPLTIAEVWWGIFDALSNRDRAARGDVLQRLTTGEYRRHRQRLIDAHARELALVRRQLVTWPRLRTSSPRAAGLRRWMEQFDDCIDHNDLTPADAAHLALAGRYARSFVTNDGA
jgi:predicted nucleic acid-binding protein